MLCNYIYTHYHIIYGGISVCTYNYMYNIYIYISIYDIFIYYLTFFWIGFAEETRAEEVDCPSLFLALCLRIEASKPQLIRVGPAELLAEEARNHISCRNTGSLLCTLECVYIYILQINRWMDRWMDGQIDRCQIEKGSM